MDLPSTDYYRQKWNVTSVKQATGTEMVTFGVVMTISVVGSVGGAWLLNQYLGLYTRELFYELSFFCLVIIVVLGFIWNKLLLRDRSTITRYSVSQAGIEINRNVYDLSEIKKEALLKKLDKLEPQHMTRANLVLIVPLNKGNIKLVFESEKMYHKVVLALKRYLEVN